MKRPLYKFNKNSSLTARLVLTTALMIAAPASFADQSNLAYVDSVLKWGAWGLDIEPAAGGLSQPTTQALNARNSKVTLRTNSFAALAPPGRAIPAIPATPAVPATPTIPAVPAIPAIPAVTPISPSVPIPVGAP
ncbi:MAG: hypothetical protein GQ550_07875 [Gammaproteobacteria bacterium]|nr:hypothetical protein [Gammaproteobacteria bacterium]